MLPSRLRLIGSYLRGDIDISILANELGVSPMLIREELLPYRGTQKIDRDRILKNLTDDYNVEEDD